jgi:hypothetical protein
MQSARFPRFALENRRSCHLMLPKRDHQGTFAWRTRDVGVSGILFDLTYINTSTALYQFSVSNVDAAARGPQLDLNRRTVSEY